MKIGESNSWKVANSHTGVMCRHTRIEKDRFFSLVSNVYNFKIKRGYDVDIYHAVTLQCIASMVDGKFYTIEYKNKDIDK